MSKLTTSETMKKSFPEEMAQVCAARLAGDPPTDVESRLAEAFRGIDTLARAERTREIADWLEAHALGTKAEFYAPSKSGVGTLENAVLALRGGKP